MKKLSTLKTLLVGLCAMAATSAWAQTTTVGAEDNSADFFSAFSDYYTLSPNQTLTISFKNYSSKEQNFHNWIGVLTTDADRDAKGYSEYVVLRCDNYGWGTTWLGSKISSNYNWDTFKEDMDGSTVDMTVKRFGPNAIIHADITTTDDKHYFEEYSTFCGDGSQNIRFFLTVEKAHLTDISANISDNGATSESAGWGTLNADINFSNAITNGAVTGAKNSIAIPEKGGIITTDGWLALYDKTSTITIPEAERAGNRDVVHLQFKKAWGNKNGMGSGFYLKDAEGKPIAEFQFARWGGGTNTLGIDMNGLVGAKQNNNAPMAGRYTIFDITVNYAKKTITSYVECVNPAASKIFSAQLTNTNPIATFEVNGYKVGDNPERADIIDDIIIETVKGDYNVQTYDYTVNWVCGNTTVKSETRNDEADAEISLSNNDKSSFTVDNKKYIYVSDDAEGKTVSSSGNTVITISLREAETWKFSVNAKVGEEVLSTIFQGTVTEGEVASYGYSQYIAKDGKLYKSDKQSNNPWWGKSFTPVADNETQDISYVIEGTEGIVYCSEAEDIEGANVVSSGNTDIRASYRKGAFGTNVKVTTLTPGKYKLYTASYGNAGTTFIFKAGNKEILALATDGNPVHTTSEEFAIYANTDITFNGGNGGNSPKVVDYIIIQKTDDVEIPSTVPVTISDAGYATFISDYALDFSNVDGLTAYTASTNGERVEFTEAGKVPANTGVLLKGAAKTYNVPIVTDGGDATSLLIGGTTAPAGSFVLMKVEDKVGFYKTKDKEEFTLTANTAYIPSTASAREFIAIDDEATGISAVKGAEQSSEVFNLNGQRVNKAQKGLYIQNGKKVVVK